MSTNFVPSDGRRERRPARAPRMRANKRGETQDNSERDPEAVYYPNADGRTGTTWSRFPSSGRPMLYLVWRTHSLQARCSPLYKTVVNIATQGGARRRTDGRTELRRAGCKSSCNSEDYPFVDRSIDRSKAGPPILLLFHCLLRLSLTFSHRARAREPAGFALHFRLSTLPRARACARSAAILACRPAARCGSRSSLSYKFTMWCAK